MHIRLAAAAGALVALVAFVAGPAVADDAVVLVSDSEKVTLTRATDGSATAAVVLENQGASPVTVTAEAGAGCKIEPVDGLKLPGHWQRKLTFTFPAACGIDDKEGIPFTVTAVGMPPFEMHANPPTKANPDWSAVTCAYVVSTAVALVVLVGAWVTWKPPGAGEWRIRTGWGDKATMSLPGLSASWKFTDSWAANATVVTALFAGLFGAQAVAEALLGDAAKTVLAVAVVSAALSLGLTGLSPMVLQSLRRNFAEVLEVKHGRKVVKANVEAGLYVTPYGLLSAALFTLAATGGQLWSLLWAVRATEFGDDYVFVVIGAIASAGLAVYAWRTTKQSLDAGAKVPAPAEVVKTAQKVAEDRKAVADEIACRATEAAQAARAAAEATGLVSANTDTPVAEQPYVVPEDDADAAAKLDDARRQANEADRLQREAAEAKQAAAEAAHLVAALQVAQAAPTQAAIY